LAEKDITSKTLEAFDDVFADIVNGLLFHGKQVLQEQALIDAQPVSMYKADGQIHEQERDVSKYWVDQDGEHVNIRVALMGIENQSTYDQDMPLRVIGYDGGAYRAQLGQKARYPVVTLVLYFGEKPWGRNHSLYDAIKIPDQFRPFVNDYRINLFDISRLPGEAVGYFHSDFKIIVDYFVGRRDNPEYRPKDPQKFKHVDEVLKMLSVFTGDSRFSDFITQEGGRPATMCEVLDRAENKGREDGIKKGEENARLEDIRNIMESLQITAREAMALLKLPEEDWPMYESRL
jgi:hypothetical protein